LADFILSLDVSQQRTNSGFCLSVHINPNDNLYIQQNMYHFCASIDDTVFISHVNTFNLTMCYHYFSVLR
jgi:hypothetical protein